MEIEVKIKKLSPTACLPKRGSSEAAGVDICADLSEPVEIQPGETKLIGSGLSVAIPSGYFGGIFARSGLSLKEGLRPANCVGVVDADYRGEIKTALHNDSDTVRVIEPGQRISQMVIMPYLPICFEEVEELPETERGEAGYGSTGR